MARRARRYDSDSKLNVKKIIAVAVLLLVVIMFCVGIKSLLQSHSSSKSGKIETVSYFTIYDNGKWGVINSYGDTVIEPTYEEMIIIPDSTKAVFVCTYEVDYAQGTYKTKLINENGKEIVKDYDNVEAVANYGKDQNVSYESNVIKVKKVDKYGLIDFSGKEILPCEYDNIDTLKGVQNSLILTKDNLVGLCDDSGNIIIEPKYKRIEKIEEDYKNGYIVVNEEEKYGIISFDKSVVLECNYEEIKPVYSKDLFIVKKDGKLVAIDKDGNTILENKFEDVTGIKGEYLAVKNNGKAGVISLSGETKIPFEYDEIKLASTEICIAIKDDKYGVISLSGETKLPFEYIEITYVSAGNLIIADYVESDKLMSKVFNSNFEEKITGTVLEINSTKGYIKVSTDEDYKYYNFKFEEIDSSTVLNTSNLFLSKKDGKYGFVDKNGNVVVDYIYDDATEQNLSGYAAVKKDGLWGSIDINGKVVIEPEYNLDNNSKVDFIGSWHLCEDNNANYYLDV